jgi:integrase
LRCSQLVGKQPDDYVLTRNTKNGPKRVKTLRASWLRVTEAAGIPRKAAIRGEVKGQLTRPGIRFHNTRNTAATRMIAAGAAEVEAMDIGGWKTRSIFEHYHITDETAKKRIAQRMAKAATQELTTVLTTGENNRARSDAAVKANRLI